GDDVDIEEGFEANGWIVIRNPMPTIVFLFVYLSHLLRMGEEDAAEDVLSEFVDGERDREPLVIPGSARVSDDVWRVSTPATVGDDCRVHGNLRARTLEVGRDNIVFGSLRARSDVTVGRGTEIKGDVSTRDGDVRIGPGATVWGDVAAADVELHENATVEGTIRARGEMRLHTDAVIQRPDETAAAMAEMARELGDGPDGEGNEPGACDTADSLRDDDGAADGEGDAEADRDTADAAERDTADASDADEPASPEASD
ncbi:MAG: polymer-forming cytoskeletal protein, partial [Haloarculaceae archaeon]